MTQPPFARRPASLWLVCLSGTVLATAGFLRSEEPARPEEPPALRFARRDVERTTAAVTETQQRVATATTHLETAQKRKQAADAAKTAADQALATSVAALQAAEVAQTAANEAAATAAAAAKAKTDDAAATQEDKDAATLAATTAAKTAEEAKAAVEVQTANKTAAEAAVTAAVAEVAAATAALPPAQEAKTAADQALAPLAPIQAATAARLTRLEAAPPALVPENAHLVQTYTYNRPFCACKFDPSGEFIFGGAQDNLIQRWDVLLTRPTPFAAHRSWPSSFAFQPGTGLLVSAAFDGKLNWWDPRSTSPAAIRTVDAHKGQIRAVAFSPDGTLVATGGNDRFVRIWSAEDGHLVAELSGHANHVYSLTFHPEGRHLVSGDLLGVAKVWETATWQAVRDLDASQLHKYDAGFQADCGGTRAMDFSPDGRYLAIGGMADVTNAFAGIGVPRVVLFDWQTGQILRPLKPKEGVQGSIFGLKFHPDGQYLIGAGGSGSGVVWFWKMDQEAAVFELKTPSVAYDLALHPDGLRLATGNYDNTVRIYDLGPKPADAK